MTQTKFDGLSLRARISYCILCAENYTSNIYPERNWKPLYNKLWLFAGDMYWDDWSESIAEVTPEYLFEFSNYEDSQFEYISKSEYNLFVNLFRNTDNGINTILLRIIDMEHIYAYSSITDECRQTLPLLAEIESVLNYKNVPLPNIEKISFSKITDNNGWGDKFDGKSLSQII